MFQRISLTRAAVSLGIVLRAAAVLLVVPVIQIHLFAPFLGYTIEHPSLDVWSTWVNSGGAPDAFPYGPAMVVPATFGALIGQLTQLPFGIELGLGLLAMIVEGAIWLLSISALKTSEQRKSAAVLFALSPILIFSVYLHGQLDLIPTVLILLSMLTAQSEKWRRSGLWLGLAIAAKLSALLVLPVVVVFLARNRRFRSSFLPFVQGLTPGLIIALIPLLSSGYRRMVLDAPQIESFFGFGIPLGGDNLLLLAPLAVVAALAITWHYRRGNVDLFILIVAILLAAVPVLVPASPGWFLWALPLLVLLASQLHRRHRWYLMMMFAAEGAWTAVTSSWAALRFNPTVILPGDFLSRLFETDGQLTSLIGTAAVACAIVVLASLWRAAAKEFNSYNLSRAPLTIAVAGDSSTGKDTMCRLVGDVFADANPAFVMGDDYHIHERGSSAWRTKTHLDPAANSLSQMATDFNRLAAGESVWSRHYDHERGRFTSPRQIRAGDLIIANGLHVLNSSISENVDLSVFLDMDETLRTLLKLRRDVTVRGHTKAAVLDSIDRRAADKDAFITPQEGMADLIIRIEPSIALPSRDQLTETDPVPPLKVVAELRNSVFVEDFVRVLSSMANAQVKLSYLNHDVSRIEVNGTEWITARDITGSADSLVTRRHELTSASPEWSGGSMGVAQLIVVLCLLERRATRWSL